MYRPTGQTGSVGEIGGIEHFLAKVSCCRNDIFLNTCSVEARHLPVPPHPTTSTTFTSYGN